MEYLEWKPVYSVGIPEIDQEHLQLFNLFNRLTRATEERQLSAAIGPIVDDLVNYTLRHFDHEEAEMAAAGYPGLERHRAEHRRLADQVLEYQTAYRAGKLSQPEEVMGFLKSWLTGHIMGSDSLYGAFVNRPPATE